MAFKWTIRPVIFDSLREGGFLQNFQKDLFAGITVGIVALPLAMAFSIASGLTPDRGLFTAVTAGFLISLLGGSRVQIGGPTGAFVVIVFDIVARHGYEGLAVATIMAGIILIVFALSGFGKIIKYIPYPVTTGFTAGIAVIIFSSQVKDFLGLSTPSLPGDFIGKWAVYFQSMHTVQWTTLFVGALSLLSIILIRKFAPKIPGPLVAVVLAAFMVPVFNLNIETIGSRFGGIAATLPMPSLPDFSFKTMKELFPDALTIAFLAAIESLLSAVVADGMTGYKHKSDTELMGQGLANVVSILFGGIPATGAIARTATNIKSGARTPLAGMVHALTVFILMLFFSNYASMIPLCSLAAILFVVSWNMSEIDHFIHMFKAPLSDSIIMVTVFLLTVFTDLTLAVQTGVVLAAVLFIKRLSDVSDSVGLSPVLEMENQKENDPEAIFRKNIPEGVEVYEINGPFFFGVADRLTDILDSIEERPKVFILRMRRVPVIDATGLHALGEFKDSCRKRGAVLILSGISKPIGRSFRRVGIDTQIGRENICSHINKALKRAGEIIKEQNP